MPPSYANISTMKELILNNNQLGGRKRIYTFAAVNHDLQRTKFMPVMIQLHAQTRDAVALQDRSRMHGELFPILPASPLRVTISQVGLTPLRPVVSLVICISLAIFRIAVDVYAGTLPPSFSSLTNLQAMFLSSNTFNGVTLCSVAYMATVLHFTPHPCLNTDAVLSCPALQASQ